MLPQKKFGLTIRQHGLTLITNKIGHSVVITPVVVRIEGAS